MCASHTYTTSLFGFTHISLINTKHTYTEAFHSHSVVHSEKNTHLIIPNTHAVILYTLFTYPFTVNSHLLKLK